MRWMIEEDWIFKNVIFLISFTSMLIGWAREKKCYSYASLVDFFVYHNYNSRTVHYVLEV